MFYMIIYTNVKWGGTKPMTEINQKIIDMVNQKCSIEEISNAINLSYKQIYNRISSLENQGYLIKRRYDTNGVITYTFGYDNSYHINNSS